MSSFTATIAAVAANDASITTVAPGTMDQKSHIALAEAMANNTQVTTVNLERTDLGNEAAIAWGEALKTNSSIETLDMGYNNIKPDGIIALAIGIKANSTLTIVKIHRQRDEYGTAAEEKLANIYSTNITLQRLYATMHDRTYSQVNTRGEVRNRTIAGRIKAGEQYRDLDPATASDYVAEKKAEAKAKAEADAKANAPISEKVESTGGPYTFKQLTCDAKYRPDDVDPKKRESYLTDEEFQTVMGISKDEFNALAGWKKTKLKKAKKLF